MPLGTTPPSMPQADGIAVRRSRVPPGWSYRRRAAERPIIAGVADGHVNTSKVFDLGYQRLTVGGVFRYDSLNRGYGTTPDLLALG